MQHSTAYKMSKFVSPEQIMRSSQMAKFHTQEESKMRKNQRQY